VSGQSVEYGVVEYRLAHEEPDVYAAVLRRYGHRAIAPRTYTTSSFLGGALGQLAREGLIDGGWTKATGYWSYNGDIGCYGKADSADNSRAVLSWDDFARENGVDPAEWPYSASALG